MSTLQRVTIALGVVLAVGCTGDIHTTPPPPLPSISKIAICCVPPRYAGLNVGSELPLFVFAFDSVGDTLGIHPTATWWHGGASSTQFSVTWWSSDSSIASVDIAGVVSSRAIGATYIHARTISLLGARVDSVLFPTTSGRPASRTPMQP